jgi:hypothetical protein
MRGRQLLLVPFLSPLLAVLLVAAFNPEPRVSFRVLTWETPEAPLGIWLAAAALGGATLSGGAAGLALRQGADRRGRRRVSGQARDEEPWFEPGAREENWRSVADGARASQRRDPQATSARAAWGERAEDGRAEPMDSVAPARAPGEPAPTVVVPFRILRRPGSPPMTDAAPVVRAQPAPAPTGSSVPVAATDDWGDPSTADDW